MQTRIGRSRIRQSRIRLHSISLFALLILPCAGFALTASQILELEDTWNFRVLLDGDEIGYHAFRVSGGKDLRVVESEAQFTVTFLGFEAYRYEHVAREVWEGNCLRSIDARTDNNGESLQVIGNAAEPGFVVESADGIEVLPGCAMSFAYWNPNVLGAGKLLNAQTGEYQQTQALQVPNSAQLSDALDPPHAEWLLQVGDREIRLWYGKDQRWIGLQTETPGGRVLRYELRGQHLSWDTEYN